MIRELTGVKILGGFLTTVSEFLDFVARYFVSRFNHFTL